MQHALTFSPLERIQAQLHKLNIYSAMLLLFFLPISTSLTVVFFFLTIFLSLISGHFFRYAKIVFRQPLVWTFCALSLIFLLGTVHSIANHVQQWQVVKRYSKYFFAIFLMPIFMCPKVAERSLQCFVLAALLTTAAIILHSVGLVHFTFVNDRGVYFKNHIDTSFLLAIACFILALVAIRVPKRRLTSAVSIAVMLFVIFYLSNSRSGYLITCLLTLLFAFQYWRWKGLFMASAILAVCLAGLLAMPSSLKQTLVLTHKDMHIYEKVNPVALTSPAIRADYYKTGLAAVREHPLVGTGTGSIELMASQINPNYPLKTTNLHNEYLNITLQLGVAGLLVLLALFYTAFRTSLTLPSFYRHIMQAVLLAIVVGCFINSWLMDALQSYTFAILLMICLASRYNLARTEKSVM